MFGAVTEDGFENDFDESEQTSAQLPMPTATPHVEGRSHSNSNVSLPPVDPPLSLVQLALKGGNEKHREVLAHLLNLQVTDAMAENIKELSASHGSKIPVEWVVEIADENLNWFIGTAYTYDDENRTIHVFVPDKTEPTWEGDMPLDFRACHMIECCDDRSTALYNVAITSGLMEVDWRFSWVDEEDGSVYESQACWFLPLAYQVLAEDPKKQGQYKTVSLQSSVVLLACECDGLGQKAFFELVDEGVVGYTGPPPPINGSNNNEFGNHISEIEDLHQYMGQLMDTVNHDRLRVHYSLQKELRTYFHRAVDERDRLLRDHNDMLDGLYRLIWEGDLLEGCALFYRLEGPENRDIYAENKESINTIREAVLMIDNVLQKAASIDSIPNSAHSQRELQEQYLFEDLNRQLRVADKEYDLLNRQYEDLKQEYDRG